MLAVLFALLLTASLVYANANNLTFTGTLTYTGEEEQEAPEEMLGALDTVCGEDPCVCDPSDIDAVCGMDPCTCGEETDEPGEGENPGGEDPTNPGGEPDEIGRAHV